MENFLGWTDKQIEDLINSVYGGVISKKALPMDLYESILGRFDGAIIEGFGAVGDNVAKSNLAIKLGENIKQFSFAKTFQQINDMGNLIFDSAGNQIAFSEFKKNASKIFDIYNNNWLETEFNTAKSITESARQWLDIQENKDILPLLKYSTVGDDRVRADHRTLDGIIRPVNDPFWLENYPPNDFNCRCIVDQIEEGEITDLNITKAEPVNPLFRNNPAVTGEVFSKKDHPYFNGLGSLLSNPIKDILPKPKPVPKINKNYSFKNNREAKAAIIRDIETNSALKINKVTLSSKLDIKEMEKRADKVKELFTEYKISDAIANNPDYGTDLVFKSTKGTYGSVSSGRRRSDGQKFIAKINFGDQTDGARNRKRIELDDTEVPAFRGKSATDDEIRYLATNVHEFAHVISTDRNVLSGVKNTDFNFFKELREIRVNYTSELAKLANDFEGSILKREQYKIHLGSYANTNINEFMAEGFTEYKLHSKPSKYALKIGQLIDKYYKK
jgi:SPP1 gp7 family putative phage head morphogenesis protein